MANLTEAEKIELAQLEKEFKGLTNEEMQELAELEKEFGASPQPAAKKESEEGLFDRVTETGKEGLMTALKGLDYLGGLARTGAAQSVPSKLAQFATGTDISPDPQADILRTLKGEAPTGSEYLERAGVPEMGQFSNVAPWLYSETGEGLPLEKGGALDPTGRGAVGMPIDMMLDPLTYLSVGGVPAIKAAGKKLISATAKQSEKLANNVLSTVAKKETAKEISKKVGDGVRNSQLSSLFGNRVKNMGESIYESGLKNVDKKLASQRGVKPLSKVLLESGTPSGSMASLKKQIDDVLMPQNMEARTRLYKEASDAGVSVDASRTLDDARAIIEDMKSDPGLRDKANSLEEFVNKYADEGRTSIEQMSNWKTNLYDSLPKSAFDEAGKISSHGKKINKALAKGFKEEIESAGDFARPGLGKEIEKANSNWGSMKGAQKPLRTEIDKATTVNRFTSIDAMLPMVVGGSTQEPLLGAAALLLKKTSDVAKTTGARTRAGKLLKGVGDTGLVDPALRRLMINSSQQRNPWEGDSGQ